jgi:hypothetical protein
MHLHPDIDASYLRWDIEERDFEELVEIAISGSGLPNSELNLRWDEVEEDASLS